MIKFEFSIKVNHQYILKLSDTASKNILFHSKP